MPWSVRVFHLAPVLVTLSAAPQPSASVPQSVTIVPGEERPVPAVSPDVPLVEPHLSIDRLWMRSVHVGAAQ